MVEGNGIGGGLGGGLRRGLAILEGERRVKMDYNLDGDSTGFSRTEGRTVVVAATTGDKIPAHRARTQLFTSPACRSENP